MLCLGTVFWGGRPLYHYLLVFCLGGGLGLSLGHPFLRTRPLGWSFTYYWEGVAMMNVTVKYNGTREKSISKLKLLKELFLDNNGIRLVFDKMLLTGSFDIYHADEIT